MVLGDDTSANTCRNNFGVTHPHSHAVLLTLMVEESSLMSSDQLDIDNS